MKQCSACKTTYTDDSLSFCLHDGAALISVPDDAKTVQMSFENNPASVNIPPDSVPTVFPPVVSANQPKRSGAGLLIAAAVIGLLFLVFAGIAALFLLNPFDRKETAVSANASPTVSTASTPNDETTVLKEKLANLEKQVRQQKNQPPIVIEKTPAAENHTERTARVNSPNDGFLALRTAPNSETGNRIAKIPHGATVTVLGCPKPSNTGKIPGRWCQVIYGGQTGWAFDAFLVY